MKVLDTSRGKVVSTIPILQGRVVTSNSKCQLLIVGTSDLSHFLQLLDGTTVIWRKEDILPHYVGGAFSPKEQFLVVGTTGKCLVLDAETGNTLRTIPTSPPFSLNAHCTFISDDSCVTLITSKDLRSRVELLNVKSGERLSAIDVDGFGGCLAACHFNCVFAIGLVQFSAPNFKVVRVHLPRGGDRGNGNR